MNTLSLYPACRSDARHSDNWPALLEAAKVQGDKQTRDSEVRGSHLLPWLQYYSKSHFKSVTFALHVFRSLLMQFSSDYHEI